jgi:lipoprotein-anchoring transpeptidase ErfK/SrfK
VALLGVAGIIIWQLWPAGNGKDKGKAGQDVKGIAKAPGAGGKATDANTAGRPATTQKAPAGDNVIRMQDLTPAAALEAVKTGNSLLAAKKVAEGRAALSEALLSGTLPPASAENVRKTLADLSDKMLLSAEIFDGDPYTYPYTCKTGDVLVRVERTEKLHVPIEAILRINHIADAGKIRAGQTIKLIRGPFHAIVDKGAFTMDLYLHREGCAPAFVKRLRVGLGKNGSTPLGLWRVKLGTKQPRANWFPPPNAEQHRSIRWGEVGYPLGAKGYWIGLEGTDDATRSHTGYGIHGTNDPTSIGKSESLGCIRLADPDIELVFSLLYESWSTVKVRS